MSKGNVIGLVLVIAAMLGCCYIIYDLYKQRISDNAVATELTVAEELADDHK